MVILVFLRSNPRIKIPDFFKEEGLRKLLSHLAGVHESRWFCFVVFCFTRFLVQNSQKRTAEEATCRHTVQGIMTMKQEVFVCFTKLMKV